MCSDGQLVQWFISRPSIGRMQLHTRPSKGIISPVYGLLDLRNSPNHHNAAHRDAPVATEACRSRSPRLAGVEGMEPRIGARRPQIMKARLASQHKPVLPGLNLKALEPTVSGWRSKGIATSRDSRRSGVTTASDVCHAIQAYGAPPRPTRKKKPEAAPLQEFRAWSPTEVNSPPSGHHSKNLRHSQSPAPFSPSRRKPAPSGAATERTKGRSMRVEKDAASKKRKDDRFSAPATPPYVDLVQRHANLDLGGSVRFPTRGGLRKARGGNNAEAGPMDSFYQDLLKKFPANTRIRRDFASRLHSSGRQKEAERQIRHCLALEPFNPTTLNAFAMLLWDQKKYSKSQDMLVRALKADPRCLAVLMNYAISNLILAKPSSALQYFSRALDINHDLPVALLGCAVAMEDLDVSSPDEIESIYQRVLELDPTNFEALFAYGRFCKSRRHDWSKAEQYYLEALNIRPHDVNALVSYGALLSEQTETNKFILWQAAVCFQKALAREPSHFEATYNYAVLLARWERNWQDEHAPQGHQGKCPVVHLHLHQNQHEIAESLHELPVDAISTSADRRLLAVQLYRKVLDLMTSRLL